MPLAKVWKERYKGGTIAFMSGNFNVLHAGHIRLLKYAKEQADVLLVGISTETTDGAVFPGELRVEAVKGLDCVTDVGVIDADILRFISDLQPDLVIKGKEHEVVDNPEKQVTDSYGGKLVFGTDETEFSTVDILSKELEYNKRYISDIDIDYPEPYITRHNLSNKDLLKVVDRFSELKVVTVGDLIIDDYIDCQPLGMSQEDPTLVVSPKSTNTFIGGAGIVAGHAHGLGAKSYYFGVSGDDSGAVEATDFIAEQGLHAKIIKDKSRPTTRKQRYRASGKTLLRVNHIRQVDIDEDLVETLGAAVIKELEDANALIFSDFSYGCLPQKLIDRLIAFAKDRGIIISADSQSSSQLGDINRFKDVDLLTPTEREARLSLSDTKGGLVSIASNVCSNTQCKNLIITLGAAGILIHRPTDVKNVLLTDELPALNKNSSDVAGAGDSLLVTTTMCLALGCNIWEAAYIGSIAAANQVNRIGNIPLNAKEIKNVVNKNS